MISGAVRSIVAGKHAGGGSVIITTGSAGADITTVADGGDRQPEFVLTLNVYVPVSSPVIVKEIPEPVDNTSPGERIIVHIPVDGRAVSVTLPVGTRRVGCIIVSMKGTVGTGGWAGIITSTDNIETHPAPLVEKKLYVPDSSPVIVVLGPEPLVFTVPGYRVRVHVPDEGNPDKVTLPVETVHVGAIIVPGTGDDGVRG